VLIPVSRVLSKLAEKGKSRFFKDACKARANGGGLEGSETQIAIPGGITSIRFPFAPVINTFWSQPRLALSPSLANIASKSSPNRADSVSPITQTISTLCMSNFERPWASSRFSSAVKYRGPLVRWSLASSILSLIFSCSICEARSLAASASCSAFAVRSSMFAMSCPDIWDVRTPLNSSPAIPRMSTTRENRAILWKRCELGYKFADAAESYNRCRNISKPLPPA
jgi:hypothetical protein